MTHSKVAHRYALSLIELAEQFGIVDEVNRDIEVLRDLMSRSREFSHFLRSPVVNLHRKQKILSDILNGKVQDLTLRFVLLLAAKTRAAILGEVVRQFTRLRDERQGIVNASVKTVVAMNNTEQQALAGRLGKYTGKTIRMSYSIEPALKAGFTVQFNDTVWDASVRRQLEVLRNRFMEGDD
jgi:F-type H+-transporting ATPase subunit delta